MPSVRLTILLPPSEGKAEGGGRPPWKTTSGRFGRALGRHRSDVADALAAAGGGDGRLLGVSGRHLERARLANSTVVGSATLPAHRRYTGVVWDHIGFDTLDGRARERASESVVVLSALLGAAGIDDPVPDYKLKMGAALAPMGRLSTFWRRPLTGALDAQLAGTWVVDLLPIEHRAAWTPSPHLYAGHVAVAFVEKSGQVAGHDAKAAKGMLVKHLLESKLTPQRALSSWRHPRFTLDY